MTGVLVVLVAASGVGPGVAGAETRPPGPATSAVSQYVEVVPTADGSQAPGAQRERRTPLPKKARQSLAGVGKEIATPLATIATSSSFGAPAKSSPGGVSGASGAPARPGDSRSVHAALPAAPAAAEPEGDARFTRLLLAVGAITLGGAALALRGRLGP